MNENPSSAARRANVSFISKSCFTGKACFGYLYIGAVVTVEKGLLFETDKGVDDMDDDDDDGSLIDGVAADDVG